jgi:hypothetical protein
MIRIPSNSKERKYSYRVIWSEEDQEHVGLCAEFPSLSHLDEDAGRALAGIQELVGQVVAEKATVEDDPDTIEE